MKQSGLEHIKRLLIFTKKCMNKKKQKSISTENFKISKLYKILKRNFCETNLDSVSNIWSACELAPCHTIRNSQSQNVMAYRVHPSNHLEHYFFVKYPTCLKQVFCVVMVLDCRKKAQDCKLASCEFNYNLPCSLFSWLEILIGDKLSLQPRSKLENVF